MAGRPWAAIPARAAKVADPASPATIPLIASQRYSEGGGHGMPHDMETFVAHAVSERFNVLKQRLYEELDITAMKANIKTLLSSTGCASASAASASDDGSNALAVVALRQQVTVLAEEFSARLADLEASKDGVPRADAGAMQHLANCFGGSENAAAVHDLEATVRDMKAQLEALAAQYARDASAALPEESYRLLQRLQHDTEGIRLANQDLEVRLGQLKVQTELQAELQRSDSTRSLQDHVDKTRAQMELLQTSCETAVRLAQEAGHTEIASVERLELGLRAARAESKALEERLSGQVLHFQCQDDIVHELQRNMTVSNAASQRLESKYDALLQQVQNAVIDLRQGLEDSTSDASKLAETLKEAVEAAASQASDVSRSIVRQELDELRPKLLQASAAGLTQAVEPLRMEIEGLRSQLQDERRAGFERAQNLGKSLTEEITVSVVSQVASQAKVEARAQAQLLLGAELERSGKEIQGCYARMDEQLQRIKMIEGRQYLSPSVAHQDVETLSTATCKTADSSDFRHSSTADAAELRRLGSCVKLLEGRLDDQPTAESNLLITNRISQLQRDMDGLSARMGINDVAVDRRLESLEAKVPSCVTSETMQAKHAELMAYFTSKTGQIISKLDTYKDPLSNSVRARSSSRPAQPDRVNGPSSDSGGVASLGEPGQRPMRQPPAALAPASLVAQSMKPAAEVQESPVAKGEELTSKELKLREEILRLKEDRLEYREKEVQRLRGSVGVQGTQRGSVSTPDQTCRSASAAPPSGPPAGVLAAHPSAEGAPASPKLLPSAGPRIRTTSPQRVSAPSPSQRLLLGGPTRQTTMTQRGVRRP